MFVLCENIKVFLAVVHHFECSAELARSMAHVSTNTQLRSQIIQDYSKLLEMEAKLSALCLYRGFFG